MAAAAPANGRGSGGHVRTLAVEAGRKRTLRGGGVTRLWGWIAREVAKESPVSTSVSGFDKG